MGAFQENTIHSGLFAHGVGLNFEVKTVVVKDGGQFHGFLLGLFDAAGVDEIGDGPFKAGRQGDQASVVLSQKLFIL